MTTRGRRMKRFPGDVGAPRVTGALRPSAGPEHNLIQRPDLTFALRERLGLRQAHIAPTLDENVQPVVIIDDLRSNAGTARRFAHANLSLVGNPVNNKVAGLYLNVNSKRIITDIKLRIVGHNNASTTDPVWVDIQRSMPAGRTGSVPTNGAPDYAAAGTNMDTNDSTVDGYTFAGREAALALISLHLTRANQGEQLFFHWPTLVLHPGDWLWVWQDHLYPDQSILGNWEWCEELRA